MKSNLTLPWSWYCDPDILESEHASIFGEDHGVLLLDSESLIGHFRDYVLAAGDRGNRAGTYRSLGLLSTDSRQPLDP